MTPEEYQAKREARYQRLLAAADKAAAKADALLTQAHDMASIIPFGQPILVGHHSEGRDRRYRGRIDNKFRKGYELHKEAQALKGRADAMAHNKAIFSDDPQVVEKLEEKIARLEERQRVMKQTNLLVRKKDRVGLQGMGYKDATIDRLLAPDDFGRMGFPSYALTNNNANIQRLKKRIKVVEAHADDVTSEHEINGVTVTDNVEDNRMQMQFPGKPSAAIRDRLKHAGYRWTPTKGIYQAYRNHNARFFANQIAGDYRKEAK